MRVYSLQYQKLPTQHPIDEDQELLNSTLFYMCSKRSVFSTEKVGWS